MSCQQPELEPVISKSDSLLSVLDSAERKLNGIDVQKLSLMVDTIKYDASFINTQLEDTVDVDLAMSFDSYLLVKKSNERIIRAVQDHDIRVLEAKDQVKDLMHDVQEGFFGLDTARKYFRHEAKNVHQIKQNVDNLKNVAERNDTAFNELKPRVNEIIQRIRQKDGF